MCSGSEPSVFGGQSRPDYGWLSAARNRSRLLDRTSQGCPSPPRATQTRTPQYSSVVITNWGYSARSSRSVSASSALLIVIAAVFHSLTLVQDVCTRLTGIQTSVSVLVGY